MARSDERNDYDAGCLAFREGYPCGKALNIPWDGPRSCWVVGWMDEFAKHVGKTIPLPKMTKYEFGSLPFGRYGIKHNGTDGSTCWLKKGDFVVQFDTLEEAQARCDELNTEDRTEQTLAVPWRGRAVDVGG